MSAPSQEPIALSPPPRFDPEAGFEPLEDALRTETKLLHHLTRILRRQREGVAADDLDIVDDTVHDAQRILLTLGEARRRRRSLMDLLAGSEDVAVADLHEALDGRMTPGLEVVRDELQDAAKELAGELEINRRVLQTAVRTGDELLRALCGVSAEDRTYAPTPEGDAPGGAGGAIIDRRV